MKKIIILATLSLFILASCKKDDNILSDSGKSVNSSPLLSSNPYEWVGLKHNDCLDYALSHTDSSMFSGVWVDDNLIDSIAFYIDEYNVISGDSIQENYKNYIDDWVKFDNPDSLVNQYRNLLISSTSITSRDSLYSTKVLDLAVDIMNNTYSNTTILNKIDSLETEILSINWDSTEIQSLMSIAIYKNSINYHITRTSLPMGLKNTQIQHISNRTEVGVCGMADFVVGAGVFLAEVGATGGVAAPVALYTGSQAGSFASTVTSWIGHALDWW